MLEGEFGLNDLSIGVPVILGARGIEKILEIDLDSKEKNLLMESAKGVQTTNSLLKDLNLF
jgi:malate dehydrogenase